MNRDIDDAGSRASRPPFLEDGQWRITRHADVRAVLADPRYVVPAVPACPGTAGGYGMAWLRGAVSRFSNGAEHARRRSLAVSVLARLDPSALRREAYQRAKAEIDGRHRIDVMARLARRVPVGVLAGHLGVTEGLRERAVAAVTAVAIAYHPANLVKVSACGRPCSGIGADEAGDRAVDRLAALLGYPEPERLASYIGLLVQACDATAGLIGNALNLALRMDPTARANWSVDDLLERTLKHDPPVRLTRRVSSQDVTVGDVLVPGGSVAVLDLAATPPGRSGFVPGPGGPHSTARLAFGSGLRPCPGEAPALALAAGVVEAVLGPLPGRCGQGGADQEPARPKLAEWEVGYQASANMRVPARLEVLL